MARVLYFDCFSGASGDMMLGALLDAGLPLPDLQAALGGLGVDGLRVTAERVSRAGVSATKLHVHEPDAARAAHRHSDHHHHDHHAHHDHDAHHHPDHHGHDDAHHHHHPSDDHNQPHRSLADIGRLIDGSQLSAAARAKARGLVQRLGETEAGIHGVPVEQVHLHEVGALDSIVDIVGTVFAMEWFGADRVVASPLNVGGGTVRCAHGVYPVPAPATAALLGGVPVYSRGDTELVTPTGALLITAYAEAYGPLPALSIDRIGYGAGDRNPAESPNVLRVFVGHDEAGDTAREPLVVIECEIDDMNPQIFGLLMDRLQAAGALDVFFASVQMKKNRPGTLVTVLAAPERRGGLLDVLFEESTTIGVRYHDVWRERLERDRAEVRTPWGPVGVKIARRGTRVLNAQPEFDDCARLAAVHGVAVKLVQAHALRAYLEASDAPAPGAATS